MIRPFTLICALFAMGAGLYLYQAKHESQMLDRKIAAIVRATDETRTRIGMLRADYELLNDPTRLQGLADQQLTLKAIAPTQFTTMAELDRRLPPVDLAPRPAPEPVAEPDTGLFVAAAEPTPVPAPAPPAKPVVASPPRPPTAQTLAQAPAATAPIVTPKPTKKVADPSIQATPLPAPTSVALAQAPSPRHPTPPPVSAAQPVRAAPSMQQATAIRPVSDARPAFVSALGMARTMAHAPAAPSVTLTADGGGGR